VSGLILFFFDWRFLFYINVPIGIFGTAWAHFRLKEIAKIDRGAPVDWVGFGTFVTSISSLMLALTFAAYGVSEQVIVELLLVVSLLTIVAFVWYERRVKFPLLDLRLLRVKEFTSGSVAMLINVIAFSSIALLLSLYFQIVLNLSPLDAGLRLLPLDLATVLMAPVSGKLSDRFGRPFFILAGLSLISFTTYLFSTVDVSTPYMTMVVYMILLGVASSTFISPNASFSMSAVPAIRRGVAASIRATFYAIGMTVSLNIVLLIMTLRVPYHVISNLISTIGPASTQLVDRALFMSGLQAAYVWLAALNSVALIPFLIVMRRR